MERPLDATALLVLGMHRSGTSALTRTINLLGVELGQNLMAEQPDNVKGFWEEAEIVKLNDEVFAEFGQRWDDVQEFPVDWREKERVLNIKEKIVNVLTDEFSTSPIWGLKDPRLCRLLPMYKTVLQSIGHETKAILVVRDPMEVALSLHAREGMPLYYGLLLWIRYVIDAERNSRDIPRVWVTYDELLSDWRKVVNNIQNILKITWPVAADDAAPSIEQFLDPGLYHQRADEEFAGDSSALKPLAYELYALFRSMEDGQQLQMSIDSIAGKLQQLMSLFGNPSSKAEDFSAFLQENVSLAADSMLQGSALVETRSKMDLAKKLSEMKNVSDNLEVKLSEITKINDNLEVKLLESGEKLKQVESKLQNDLKSIIEQRDEAQGWLDYVHSTYSWKLTRPFRVILRLLKGFSQAGLRIDGRRISLAWYLMRQHGVLFLLKQVAHRLWQPPHEIKKIGHYPEPTIDDLEHIRLPMSERPKVSIIIPVYNKFEYTFACLRSVLKETSGEYEVIVVDDGSTDLTKGIEKYVSGIRLVTNKKNLGFIGSCNAGADIAKGEYLLFLNNDTVVTPGWLDALLEGFVQFPDAGLVGAKLVYPDGRLQEAGGIIWQDASGWNFGRFEDPNSPEYNYLREVDFCSGACILIPQILFQELGCFDERYKPAYYEDTDLAFAVRSAGRKVLYQPFAEVIHFEGITSGTDLSSGAKQYQLVNQKKFFKKWEASLQNHMPKGSDPNFACNRACTKRVFVIDSYTPMPDRDAGSLRMFHILQLLVEMGCKVTFSAENLSFHPEYSTALRKIGVETICHPYVKSMSSFLEEKGASFDAVIISRRDVVDQYIKPVNQYCKAAKVIFDTVDLHFVREAREQEVYSGKSIDGWEHAKTSKELILASQVDEIWVVSEAEKLLLKDIKPSLKVQIVSLVHDVQPTQKAFSEREGILFVGSFMHPPNIDAVNFYFEEIHNNVMEKLGSVKCYVIGADPPKSMRKWAEKYPGVEFTGYVEDIRPYFEKVRLSVAPLRFGAGIKGKINSSMSFGVPVVTTSIGAEGMSLVHGHNAMIADEAEEFARSVVELYEDAGMWQKIVREGFVNIEKLFSFDLADQALKQSIMSIQ